MIFVRCARCHVELYDPGALLFGPPGQPEGWRHAIVEKLHLCVDCYRTIRDEIDVHP